MLQLALAALIIAVVWWLAVNVSRNLDEIGMVTGFGVLTSAAGFDISWSLIPFTPSDSLARVFAVGVTNTMVVSVLAIIGATVIGTTVGIMRLSRNWLVAAVGTAYVEIIRNTPALLQIVFWFSSVFVLLPSPKQSVDPMGLGLFALNNRGLYMPRPMVVVSRKWWKFEGGVISG
ncbi:MAG: ABC transporter permease subunit [Rubellimicrobium sp.]|nr:ABC transporter permease subunit [Rubellimicrobium sp.]